MSPRRQSQLNQAVSATVLTAASGPAIGAQARMIDADMGDSASKAAVERLDQAVTELRAIKLRPLLQRAIAAIRAEDPKSAAQLALKVLRIDERSGLAWHILAIAREKTGDFRGSINCFESALALLPDHADVANDLGRLAFRMGLRELSAKLFAHYHAAFPNCTQGANNLACALRDMNDYTGAIGILRPAILANPENAMLWNTLGTVLSEQGEAAGSLPFFTEALRVDPGFAKARYNLSNAKMDLGDLDGALADCEAAMAAATTPSDLAMMRLARGFILLCQGRVSEGWAEYEARLDPHFSDLTTFLVDRPRWTPQSDLGGKTLLVFGEQGLGDEVALANLIPDVLKALGPQGRLILALEPRLIPLFQRSFPAAQIVPHITAKVDGHVMRGAPEVDQETVDLWAPLASLLGRFRPTVASYPSRSGYLVPDPARVDHWRALLSALPGPKVGLLWKSLKLEGARLKQYSPFDQWRSVLETPGVTFVNLQYGDCAAELAQARAELGLEIWQPPGIDLKQDLDDVAALCCAMDVIVGPANATSSLAGACGAPLWMISTPGAWPRLGTDAYPWYPQARVFGVNGFNQWGELMPRIAKALAEQVNLVGGTRST